MNYGLVNHEQLKHSDAVLTDKLINIGVDCVIIMDMAGNIITTRARNQKKYDIYSFAALASGHFAAVEAMAKMIGEEEFSLLFHKGEGANLQINRINTEFRLITMFGKDTPLGTFRINIVDVISKIRKIWAH